MYTEINAQAIQGTLNNLTPTKLSHGDNFNRVGVISHRHTKVQRLFKERALTYMAKADCFMQICQDLPDQAFGIVRFANLPGIESDLSDASLVLNSAA